MKPKETDIPYTIRLSNRAKRLQIKVSAHGDIEVVLPTKVSHKEVKPFINRHRQWLLDTLKRLKCNDTAPLPSRIKLPAIKETFHIYYKDKTTNPKYKFVQTTPCSLEIFTDNEYQKELILKQWLNIIASNTLIPLLQKTSDELKLPFNKATIRAQKTRWGSCSSLKNISINRNLLFLSDDVVRYLFIHELCHTRHLNHSKEFWRLVESMEPDYKKLDKSLRNAYTRVPLWALP